ncbi:hypothetical protein H671_5g15135 [Cricetulus griseus]|uniref:Uncharacterized protein n=1 Tax=Cricetulus griseus TaxID=10029 RepID=A0A061HZL5_CRIGR|nr:hypothetical protein H671_5g15135 [Cricetulus griseus]
MEPQSCLDLHLLDEFSVAGFMLRSLIHFDFSFVHGDRYGSICNLLHVDIVMATPFAEDAFFFPLYNVSFFVKNQVFYYLFG